MRAWVLRPSFTSACASLPPCSWVDWAEQHAPDELWDDGVQNYLRSGNQLLARHDDDSSSCGSGAGGSPVMAGPCELGWGS